MARRARDRLRAARDRRRTPRARFGSRTLRTGCALVGLTMIAGCGSTGSLFGRSTREQSVDAGSERAVARETPVIDTGGLAIYLQNLRVLIEGDSLTRAALFNELEDAAEFAPTKTNRLLYALALSVPGHAGSDPTEGAERLRALVAAGDTLTPEERILARILLQSANRLEVLQTATAGSEERLAEAVAAREAELAAAHAAELERVRAENEALERELEAATAMLEAITNIERSISEREEP